MDEKILIHWIGWHNMSRYKKDGGFRDLGCFNQAMLAK